MKSFVFLGLVLLVACGGAPDTNLLDSDGGSSGNDSSTGNDSPPPQDGGNGMCDVSRCANVPAGFSVISMGDPNKDCENGFTTNDVVTAPMASDGACTCGCNVTTQPDCNDGNIYRGLDVSTSPMCTTAATTFPANGGACGQVGGGGLYLNYYHYVTDAPQPTGGVCAYTATPDTSKVTSTPARLCAPPSSCVGAVCDSKSVCVAQSGDVVCPTDFPNKTLVGSGASADCSTCGASCTVGGVCAGTLAFFTDTGCSTNEVDFNANGVCVANPTSDTGPYNSYKFTGSVKSATCLGTAPSSTATAKLTGPMTVCCGK